MKENMDILVSVLMCVYNTPAQYLQEAIDSILGQTYENIEFVIVDDGSNREETLECLEKRAEEESRIKLIHNPNNIGLTGSLNVGLGECSGDYIARMDADDISMSDRIEKQVRYMEGNRDVALLGSKISFIGSSSDANDVKTRRKKSDYDLYRIRALIEHPGPAHPSFMFRASFLNDNSIRYDERIKKGQDYNIITKILGKNGKISTFDEPLLKYRVHSEQITATSNTEQLLYRSRTSYEFVKALFTSLSDAECAAVSTLGWYNDIKMMDESEKNTKVPTESREHLIKNRQSLESSDVYITALKKMISENDKRQLFPPKPFKAEMCYRWWKKAVRMTKMRHDMWGMGVFTFACYRFVICRRL